MFRLESKRDDGGSPDWQRGATASRAPDRRAPALAIWLTGLPASGKTTMGTHLQQDLERLGFENVEFLDGEAVRERLQNHRYSAEDRNAFALVKARLVAELNRAGKLVIVTGVGHYLETRRRMRRELENYIEVYLKCEVGACVTRDPKGHYRRAFAGEYENFPGVTEPYEESDEVELVLETDRSTVEHCAQRLLSFVLERIAAASGGRCDQSAPVA